MNYGKRVTFGRLGGGGKKIEGNLAHQIETGGGHGPALRPGYRECAQETADPGGGCNLALQMRSMYGAGKPRAAHDQAVEVISAVLALIKVISSIPGSWCTNSDNLPGQANRLVHA